MKKRRKKKKKKRRRKSKLLMVEEKRGVWGTSLTQQIKLSIMGRVLVEFVNTKFSRMGGYKMVIFL